MDWVIILLGKQDDPALRQILDEFRERCREWYQYRTLGRQGNAVDARRAVYWALTREYGSKWIRKNKAAIKGALDRIEALARAGEPMPCGHPRACVKASDEGRSGTNYCACCEAERALIGDAEKEDKKGELSYGEESV